MNTASRRRGASGSNTAKYRPARPETGERGGAAKSAETAATATKQQGRERLSGKADVASATTTTEERLGPTAKPAASPPRPAPPPPQPCPICQEPVGRPTVEGVTEGWSRLPCGHRFGSHCIKHWLGLVAGERPCCPVCRRPAYHYCGHPVLPVAVTAEEVEREEMKERNKGKKRAQTGGQETWRGEAAGVPRAKSNTRAPAPGTPVTTAVSPAAGTVGIDDDDDSIHNEYGIGPSSTQETLPGSPTSDDSMPNCGYCAVWHRAIAAEAMAERRSSMDRVPRGVWEAVKELCQVLWRRGRGRLRRRRRREAVVERPVTVLVVPRDPSMGRDIYWERWWRAQEPKGI